MKGQIEAILASPPEHDELVVQLFIRNGGQWGEIVRNGDSYMIEIFANVSLRLDADELAISIRRAIDELKARLEG